MLGILTELDEKPLRVMGDSSLSMDIEDMNKKLQQWPDDNICSMHDIQMKTTIAHQKLSDMDVMDRFMSDGQQPYNMQESKAKRNNILQRLYVNLHYVSRGSLFIMAHKRKILSYTHCSFYRSCILPIHLLLDL